MTDLGFQPYKENSGKEPLPYSCYQTGSGFVRQKPITTPIDKEVSEIQYIRIYHECEGRINNPSRGSPFGIRGLPCDDKW